jgi:saccharopine dehydrogenase-like NADP-dependent oxidoreductase
MNVILFGATGMVGRAALRECLLDRDVDGVLTVGRSATGQSHEKLLGRAMLEVAKHGAPKSVLETEDFRALGR